MCTYIHMLTQQTPADQTPSNKNKHIACPMHLISFKSGAAVLAMLIDAVCVCVFVRVCVCVCVYVDYCLLYHVWDQHVDHCRTCLLCCPATGLLEPLP